MMAFWKEPRDPFATLRDTDHTIGGSLASRPVLLAASGTTSIEGPVADWFKQAFHDIGQWFKEALQWVKRIWEKIKDVFDKIRLWLIDSPLMHILAGICALIPGVGPGLAAIIEAAYAVLKIASAAVAGAVATADIALAGVDQVGDEVFGALEAAGEIDPKGAAQRLSDGIKSSVKNSKEIFMSKTTWNELEGLTLKVEGGLAGGERQKVMARIDVITQGAWRKMALSDDPEAQMNGALHLTQSAMQRRILEVAPHALEFSIPELVKDLTVPADIPAMAILLAHAIDVSAFTSQDYQQAAESLTEAQRKDPWAFMDALRLQSAETKGPEEVAEMLRIIGDWFAGAGDLTPGMVEILKTHGLNPDGRIAPIPTDSDLIDQRAAFLSLPRWRQYNELLALRNGQLWPEKTRIAVYKRAVAIWFKGRDADWIKKLQADPKVLMEMKTLNATPSTTTGSKWSAEFLQYMEDHYREWMTPPNKEKAKETVPGMMPWAERYADPNWDAGGRMADHKAAQAYLINRYHIVDLPKMYYLLDRWNKTMAAKAGQASREKAALQNAHSQTPRTIAQGIAVYPNGVVSRERTFVFDAAGGSPAVVVMASGGADRGSWK